MGLERFLHLGGAATPATVPPANRQSVATVAGVAGGDEPKTLDENPREYFEERAAIGEFDGGLSRKDAEAQAARRVFEYRLADDTGQWLVVLAKPGDGLAEITESLRGRFEADRVLEVRHHD